MDWHPHQALRRQSARFLRTRSCLASQVLTRHLRWLDSSTRTPRGRSPERSIGSDVRISLLVWTKRVQSLRGVHVARPATTEFEWIDLERPRRDCLMDTLSTKACRGSWEAGERWRPSSRSGGGSICCRALQQGHAGILRAPPTSERDAMSVTAGGGTGRTRAPFSVSPSRVAQLLVPHGPDLSQMSSRASGWRIWSSIMRSQGEEVAE